MSHTLLASSSADWQAQNPVVEGRVKPFRVFDAPGLKVRALSFDAGAVMKEHRAPVPIIVQVAQGRILFRVDGAEYELGEGGSIQVEAGVLHELEAIEQSHAVLMLIG
ncbi:cupin domain-containing protein [Microbacterium sp. YY-01]|uniref:cupin domain-containing protein n=1 Tax=Microbacterium sp. YY-01 TaxID=3421634 RepID=UPI003D1752AC